MLAQQLMTAVRVDEPFVYYMRHSDSLFYLVKQHCWSAVDVYYKFWQGVLLGQTSGCTAWHCELLQQYSLHPSKCTVIVCARHLYTGAALFNASQCMVDRGGIML